MFHYEWRLFYLFNIYGEAINNMHYFTEFRRDVRVFKWNAPCATCKKAVLVVAKKGLAFVAVKEKMAPVLEKRHPGAAGASENNNEDEEGQNLWQVSLFC